MKSLLETTKQEILLRLLRMILMLKGESFVKRLGY
jgi:hypothetical protein